MKLKIIFSFNSERICSQCQGKLTTNKREGRPYPHERKKHAIFQKYTRFFRNTRDFLEVHTIFQKYTRFLEIHAIFLQKSSQYLRKCNFFANRMQIYIPRFFIRHLWSRTTFSPENTRFYKTTDSYFEKVAQIYEKGFSQSITITYIYIFLISSCKLKLYYTYY